MNPSSNARAACQIPRDSACPTEDLLQHISSLTQMERMLAEDCIFSRRGDILFFEPSVSLSPTPSICNEVGRWRAGGPWTEQLLECLPPDHPDFYRVQAVIRGGSLKGSWHDTILETDLQRAASSGWQEAELEDFFTEAGHRYDLQVISRALAPESTSPPALFLSHVLRGLKQLPPSNPLLLAARRLGQLLFDGHHPCIQESKPFVTNAYCWTLYKQIKLRAAPPLLLGDIDLNHPRHYRTGALAWYTLQEKGPFISLQDLVAHQGGTWEQLCLSISPSAHELIRSRHDRGLTKTLHSLRLEEEKSRSDWEAVWGYYRVRGRGHQASQTRGEQCQT